MKNRKCSDTIPGEWEEVVNSCKFPSTTITYNPNTYILQVGKSEIIPAPTATYPFVVATISPSDFSGTGLSFNTETASITGTPISVKSETEYTIYVYNEEGSSSPPATLTLSIVQLSCLPEQGFGLTLPGIVATKNCEVNMVGSVTRLCKSDGTWDTETDNVGKVNGIVTNCKIVSPILTYDSVVTGFTSFPIVVRPKEKSNIGRAEVSPSKLLPDGLVFNDTDYTITGSVTSPVNRVTSEITFFNLEDEGDYRVEIIFEIAQVICDRNSNWEESISPKMNYKECLDSAGYQSRDCTLPSYASIKGEWGSILDLCQSIPTDVATRDEILISYQITVTDLKPFTADYFATLYQIILETGPYGENEIKIFIDHSLDTATSTTLKCIIPTVVSKQNQYMTIINSYDKDYYKTKFLSQIPSLSSSSLSFIVSRPAVVSYLDPTVIDPDALSATQVFGITVTAVFVAGFIGSLVYLIVVLSKSKLCKKKPKRPISRYTAGQMTRGTTRGTRGAVRGTATVAQPVALTQPAARGRGRGRGK